MGVFVVVVFVVFPLASFIINLCFGGKNKKKKEKGKGKEKEKKKKKRKRKRKKKKVAAVGILFIGVE